MWQIQDISTAPPPVMVAVYFIYLPVSNKCLYSHDLNRYNLPLEHYGDISGLANMFINAPLIPIDPHTALSLNWIELDKMVDEMPYVTDSLKACLKLIKDIKETESGNDEEGLPTSSESTS